jgi:hypothetical protein
MEVIGQFCAMATFPLEKALPESFGQEAEWASVVAWKM